MKRRKFIESATTLSASAFFLGSLISCNPQKENDMKLQLAKDAGYDMDYIRGNVGYFSEKGGTIGFYADGKNTVVIDAQFPENAKHLIAELQKINNSNFKALINTHHHGDHTAGNIAFSEIVEDIIAHENSKKNQIDAGKGEQLFPKTTFAKEHSLTVGGENIQLKYFGPAHTDGDIVVYFEKANIAHIGDLVFNRKYPYIDKDHGASVENWIKVLDDILKTYDDKTLFIWGHAGEGYDIKGGKEEIKAFQGYLKNLMIIGQKAKEEKLSEENFYAKYQSIPNASEWKGEGIERSLKAIYQEVN